MEIGPLVALGGVALLLVVLCVLLGVAFAGRRRLESALDASRADVETLRARLDDLESARAASTLPVVPQAEYLITTAGVSTSSTDGKGPTDGEVAVPNRVVLSATLGEPLVKVVALGYGVRRALSPETRNRIAFEMRREVRRARKQRRREAKGAVRQARREDAA